MSGPQRVDASFTSVASRGLIRGRSQHCFVGARVIAVDALDGMEAEAQVEAIHGEIVYLRVDWSTQREIHPGRSQHATTPQELSQPGASPDRRTPISSQPEEYQPKGQQT